MRAASPAIWSLVGVTAYLAGMANAAGVVDVGLLFPRANETYEPTEEFPLVWAFRNPNFAQNLNLRLYTHFLNISAGPNPSPFIGKSESYQMNLPNTSDDNFYWTTVKFDGEGTVGVVWEGSWSQCKEEPFGPANGKVDFWRNSSNFYFEIELKKGGQKADFSAMATTDTECPDRGFAVGVTDKTDTITRSPTEIYTCAWVDNPPSPTPTANPCRVKVDKAVTESIATTDFKRKCNRILNRPDYCPPDEEKSHAIQQFATAGAAAIAVALSASGFLLLV
ncbi:hypothetical protein RB595_010462 [Gaeumannomyces hyphopodioides]